MMRHTIYVYTNTLRIYSIKMTDFPMNDAKNVLKLRLFYTAFNVLTSVDYILLHNMLPTLKLNTFHEIEANIVQHRVIYQCYSTSYSKQLLVYNFNVTQSKQQITCTVLTFSKKIRRNVFIFLVNMFGSNSLASKPVAKIPNVFNLLQIPNMYSIY